MIERNEHVAEIVRPFRNFLGEALRRDRLWLGVEIVEQIAVTRLVLHLLYRAIAFGNEEPDLRAAHLQECVGSDRRAVREECDIGGCDAAGDELADTLEHAERRVLRRARNLLDHKGAGRRIEQDQVGMGSADVNAQPVAPAAHLSTSRRSRLCWRIRSSNTARRNSLSPSELGFTRVRHLFMPKSDISDFGWRGWG